MRFGLPWRVEGIRYEARETAEAAARRAGLPLNEWLNTIILQQAAGQEPKLQPHDATHSDDRADDFSRVQQRLDDLARRIEHVARTGPSAYAPKRNPYDTDQIADRVERLEQRIYEVASYRPEFAPDTQHALSHQETHTSDAPFRLDKLEEQLRRITGQIEGLKRPGIEEAIRTLRAELSDIGRALNEALPRHAIETLEMQIQVLTQRIAEGREAGVDGGTLIGIENGLAEVRDALRELMPAENLVGYTEAINALTQKVDLIVAERNPETMRQLERSLATLREMSAHVASNDTVSKLSAQVQTIAEKIDHLAVGPRSDAKLDNLAGRIDALTRALAERAEAESAAPQLTEAFIRTLSEKIEQLQKFGASNIAADHLEDRIVKLMERIDASESRLDKLDAIERGLTDLLVHIEELRANRGSPAIRAEGPGIELLTQDIAYTRKSVDAVHRRLGDLFGRVATIEKEIHAGEADKPAIPKPETAQGDNFQFAAPPQPVSAEIPIVPEAAIETAAALETPVREIPFLPDAAPLPIAAALPASNPIETPARVAVELLTDQPLEPGSGPPRRAIPPGLRIAASEAALGGARPVAGASTSKASFIAAARRAAQAAGQEQNGRGSRADIRTAPDDATPPMRNRIATRAKSALLAASIVAIIAGSFQLLGNIFDFSIFDTIESKLTANVDSDPIGDAEEGDPTTVATIPNDEPAAPGVVETPAAPRSADAIADLLSPQSLPSLTPAPPNGIQPIPQQITPSLLAPALSVPPPAATAPSGEVTGSVARAPAKQAAPSQQPATDRLPANIGSPLLRNAALAGDAGAAYEVAIRFVEGRGVAANLEEGARWFERAASKGLTPAQFRYASMLEKGQGVKKDLAAAQRLYIAAASKGHAKAMHNLAVLYAEGAEGKPDYANAAQWFRKAAEHGVPDSQYNLGVLAARGLGTERNMAESYKWFALAAAQGDKEAVRKRDEVAAHLDAQTLVSVQQAVKGFTPAPQPPEAIQITAPPGGWDRVTQPAQEKQRAAGSISAGALASGKL